MKVCKKKQKKRFCWLVAVNLLEKNKNPITPAIKSIVDKPYKHLQTQPFSQTYRNGRCQTHRKQRI